MKTRRTLFYGIAALIFACLVLWEIMLLTVQPTEEYAAEGENPGYTMSKCVLQIIFLCLGMPFVIGAGLIGWRNEVGLRDEQRHREQVTLLRPTPEPEVMRRGPDQF